MITSSDCLLLLARINANNIDTSKMENEILENGVTKKVIKFIKENGDLDIFDFYEKLRKSYNEKRSKLYINIVKEDFTDVDSIPTTMASYVLQSLLFSKQAKDANLFLEQARYLDCCDCLLEYGKDGDLIPCIRLLQTIKQEIKALEEVK